MAHRMGLDWSNLVGSCLTQNPLAFGYIEKMDSWDCSIHCPLYHPMTVYTLSPVERLSQWHGRGFYGGLYQGFLGDLKFFCGLKRECGIEGAFFLGRFRDCDLGFFERTWLDTLLSVCGLVSSEYWL